MSQRYTINARYVPIASAPNGCRWDVPARNQGQIIEIAYADERPCRSEAGPGSTYRRVHDRSTGEVTYYRLAEAE